MGGLISSYYLKFIESKKVRKFVTLCSPFYGTKWARYFFGDRLGVVEMRPKSYFLIKLNRKKLKRVIQRDFYSQKDFIVPGRSGNSNDAISREINFWCHPLAIFWSPVVKRITDFILK